MADKYSDADRKDMAAKGHAMPDGSYPIADAEDLDNAIHAVGRGGADHDAIRRHVIGRAKDLGLPSKIPDNWNADGSLKGASSAPRASLELLKRRRGSMAGKLERRSMPFTRGSIELRAQPDGMGGSTYLFTGYGSVFDSPFDMWDQWGDPYTEIVRPGAFTQTLSRQPDVPFLIGHNDSGIPLARTRSGTMTLGEDSRGLHVEARMDGRSSLVRDLASAVERGDMDEMSIGFVTMPGGHRWSDDVMTREMLSLDLHRGDVSAVALAAAPATAGSAMLAMPGEAAWSASWQPGGEQRAQDEIIDVGGPPDSNITANGLDAVKCPYAVSNGCGVMNPGGNKFCGGCGGPLYSSDGTLVLDDSGVIQESKSDANLLSMRLRLLELA